MNSTLDFKEKKAVPKGNAKSNILLLRGSGTFLNAPSAVLQQLGQLHVANSEQEAMELLQEVVDIRLIILDMALNGGSDYKLLKYLKMNSVYQQLPLVHIAPAAEHKGRFTAVCYKVSDFSLSEIPTEVLPEFVHKILEQEQDQPADHHGIRTAYASGKLLSAEEIAWMNELESLVLQHLSDTSYDTSQLAYELLLSRSTLSRKVQYLFGINPGQYITRIRMEKALYFLQNRSYSSIARIASAVGFKHAPSFSRCFQQHFGMPPSELFK